MKKLAKPAAAKEPPKSYRNSAISVASRCEADFAADVARTLTRPQVTSAGIIENWQKDTHDINELVAELSRQVDAVNGGDLRRAEGMLISQAHSLDNIFANLARRATNQTQLPQWEAYMRMAMKAQNQCRMTLESLAAIKNPPVIFAKQANIANGPQQVNNGSAVPRTGENQFQQNGLLEANHGSTTLDAGTTATAARGNSTLEALEPVHRTDDSRREGSGFGQRMEGRALGAIAPAHARTKSGPAKSSPRTVRTVKGRP